MVISQDFSIYLLKNNLLEYTRFEDMFRIYA